MRDLDVSSAVEAERVLAGALYDHVGNWVAVEDHVVIDSCNDLGSLMGRLGPRRATAEVFLVEPLAG